MVLSLQQKETTLQFIVHVQPETQSAENRKNSTKHYANKGLFLLVRNGMKEVRKFKKGFGHEMPPKPDPKDNEHRLKAIKPVNSEVDELLKEIKAKKAKGHVIKKKKSVLRTKNTLSVDQNSLKIIKKSKVFLGKKIKNEINWAHNPKELIERNIVNASKEMVDVMYVLAGLALAMGIKSRLLYRLGIIEIKQENIVEKRFNPLEYRLSKELHLQYLKEINDKHHLVEKLTLEGNIKDLPLAINNLICSLWNLSNTLGIQPHMNDIFEIVAADNRKKIRSKYERVKEEHSYQTNGSVKPSLKYKKGNAEKNIKKHLFGSH